MTQANENIQGKWNCSKTWGCFERDFCCQWLLTQPALGNYKSLIYTSHPRGFPISIWIPWLLFMGRHYDISFSLQNLWSIMTSAWKKKTSSVSLICPDFGTNVNSSQTISKPWENNMQIFQIFYTDFFSSLYMKLLLQKLMIK